ncbi:MAG: hypothetical protein HC796_01270 [Synechococcaceae cyanobacterium RL_1_2]|nr:hypothetical protein [Synechococcaceae cyanobacterium RL_1_2]
MFDQLEAEIDGDEPGENDFLDAFDLDEATEAVDDLSSQLDQITGLFDEDSESHKGGAAAIGKKLTPQKS